MKLHQLEVVSEGAAKVREHRIPVHMEHLSFLVYVLTSRHDLFTNKILEIVAFHGLERGGGCL